MECKKCLLALAAFILFQVTITRAQQRFMKKEAYMPVAKLIKANGYASETHKAYTEDGYVIRMQRIPSGFRSVRDTKTRKPVLIVHGLLGSSADFVIMGPQRSLAYLLADEGYDVWLGNLRGNYYTSHRNMSRDEPDFWKYSFHEHGVYDLPAMIDKVLKTSKAEKLLYIGYSMGTTSFFVMMSQRPEYNEKVLGFIAMAPAVYLDNIKTFAEAVLMNVDMGRSMRSGGVYALTLTNELRSLVVSGVCRASSPNEDLCMRFIYAVVGEDYDQNDWDMMPAILSRVQPASLGQLEHFGKIALTSVFTQYDNDMMTVKPYNLTALRVPTVLLYGNNDQLTEKSQTRRLAETLKSTGVLVKANMVRWPKFNHLDFIYAKNLDKLLTRDVTRLVNKMFDEFS